MRWNESYTTLWKDCRNPGYTNSMVVHYGLKMIWCPNAKVNFDMEFFPEFVQGGG